MATCKEGCIVATKTIIRCDWDSCTASLEYASGDTIAQKWGTVRVQDLNSNTTAQYVLDPAHMERWRDNGMRILGDLIGSA
jgi:hypothetical protein